MPDNASSSDQYATPTDEWYARHKNAPDHPMVRVWYPTSVPSVRLETRFDDEQEHLYDGPIHAHVVVGGVDIGGKLEDLELLWRSVGEQLVEIRKYATELAEQDAHSEQPGRSK